jgi:hypothetical protein
MQLFKPKHFVGLVHNSHADPALAGDVAISNFLAELF